MSSRPCGCGNRRVDRPTGPESRRSQSSSDSFAVAPTLGLGSARAGRSAATTRDARRRCSRTSSVNGLSNCSTNGPLDDASRLRTRINSLRSAETVASRSADDANVTTTSSDGVGEPAIKRARYAACDNPHSRARVVSNAERSALIRKPSLTGRAPIGAASTPAWPPSSRTDLSGAETAPSGQNTI